MAEFLDVPFERLREIAQRHLAALEEGERAALLPIANDDNVAPGEMGVFILFRAIAAMTAATATLSLKVDDVLGSIAAASGEFKL